MSCLDSHPWSCSRAPQIKQMQSAPPPHRPVRSALARTELRRYCQWQKHVLSFEKKEEENKSKNKNKNKKNCPLPACPRQHACASTRPPARPPACQYACPPAIPRVSKRARPPSRVPARMRACTSKSRDTQHTLTQEGVHCSKGSRPSVHGSGPCLRRLRRRPLGFLPHTILARILKWTHRMHVNTLKCAQISSALIGARPAWKRDVYNARVSS